MYEYHFPSVCGEWDNGGLVFMYEFMHVCKNVHVCISLYMYVGVHAYRSILEEELDQHVQLSGSLIKCGGQKAYLSRVKNETVLGTGASSANAWIGVLDTEEGRREKTC